MVAARCPHGTELRGGPSSAIPVHGGVGVGDFQLLWLWCGWDGLRLRRVWEVLTPSGCCQVMSRCPPGDGCASGGWSCWG